MQYIQIPIHTDLEFRFWNLDSEITTWTEKSLA